MFFAGLLAFVVGSAVMLFLSVVILFGIVGSMTSSEPVTVGEHAILKLDFSEDLIESPSSDPFAGIDFATMTARHQVTLYNALRAIETAKNDPRSRVFTCVRTEAESPLTPFWRSCARRFRISGRVASSSSPITKPTVRGDTIWHRSPTRSTWSLTEGCSGQVFLRR